MIVVLMSVFPFQDVHLDVTWYSKPVFAFCFDMDGCVANVAVTFSMVVVVITVVVMVIIMVITVVVMVMVIMVVSMVVMVITVVVMVITVVVMVITMLITVVMVMVVRSAHLQSSHVERLFFVVAFKFENVFALFKLVYIYHGLSRAAADFSE